MGGKIAVGAGVLQTLELALCKSFGWRLEVELDIVVCYCFPSEAVERRLDVQITD